MKYKTDSKEIEQRQILPIVENINRYSQKHLEGIGVNNYSDSQKQPYPIGDNDKDIINNIKNKNNYNKEDTHKKENIPYRSDRYGNHFNWNSLYANIRANEFICSYNYYFICFNANSQAETTKPLKEYSFFASPVLAFSTISIICEFISTGNLILL